jgi:hypothetical protein
LPFPFDKGNEMTDKEIMQQALDTLENGKRVRACEGGTKYQPDLENVAITALRSRLEQPEDVTEINFGNIADEPVERQTK